MSEMLYLESEIPPIDVTRIKKSIITHSNYLPIETS